MSAGILYSIRKDIIDAFKKGIFPYIDGFQVEKETDEEMDTTIMPGLESEKSAAKKKKKKPTRTMLKNTNTKANA